MRILFVYLLAIILLPACAAELTVTPPGATASGPVLLAPTSRFMEDATRYNHPSADKVLPKLVTVTKQSYLEYIPKDSQYSAEVISANPNTRGHFGVRHAFPALAQYDANPDPRYAAGIKQCLRVFDKTVRAEVEKQPGHWHEYFMYEPTLLVVYRQVFKAHNAWTAEDEAWFKDLYLFLCRTVHVWSTPESFYRGGMHRATGEGIMKLLAVTMYPDAPETAMWRKYGEQQWNDWWQYRDNPINDINYFSAQVFPMALGATLLGRRAVFTDPGMRKFWDRLIDMTTPDGAVVPFGPAWGWNSHAGERMMALELAASGSGDGRYRYVAHRIFNYLLFQASSIRGTNLPEHFSQLGAAVAYFYCNDKIAPVQPSPTSTILYHKETLRVNGKEGGGKYIPDLDPDPLKANIDCNLLSTDKVLPFKLCLRSGWNPGDLYMLVDLFPRHEPMNPTGVIGFTRYNSVLACSINSKGLTDWQNMLRVDDLSGTASCVVNTNPATVDAYYMDVTIPTFLDRPLATYAAVDVKDYNGFPMTLRREFFFVKNRFVILRDTATFRESFLARLGPVWYTQNIGPQVGDNWANTYFSAPVVEARKNVNPPVDLLVYHAPHPDRRLYIIDETADVRRLDMPLTLRYAWEGIVQAGKPYTFAQLLLPGIPKRTPVRSNAPGAASLQDIMGQYMAAGVTTLLDTPEQSVWRIRAEEDREEWVVLNAGGAPVNVAGLQTDARQLYLDVRPGKPTRVLALSATSLSLGGQEIFRNAARGDVEK
ncbi:MAG TPA: hypothetical protein VGM23_07435 [Armatimonadota bacterium]|jgi:hypothetical protein